MPPREHQSPTTRLRFATNDQSPSTKDMTTSCMVITTAPRSGCATSARRCWGPTDRTIAAFQNRDRGSVIIFKQPGANVIETVDQIKAQLAASDLQHTARHQRHDPADRTTRRASCSTSETTIVMTIGLVVMVILCFPQLLGALIPSLTVAARARRIGTAACKLNSARQSLVMAAHHRGRLSGRRRHVVVENIHRSCRGAASRDGGPPQGLRARSASRLLSISFALIRGGHPDAC